MVEAQPEIIVEVFHIRRDMTLRNRRPNWLRDRRFGDGPLWCFFGRCRCIIGVGHEHRPRSAC